MLFFCRMDAKKKYEEWKSGGSDFIAGLQLLRDLGARHLASNLQRMNNAYAVLKLDIELAKRAAVPYEATTFNKVPAVRKEVAENATVIKKTTDDPVELLMAEKSEIYARETSLRNIMHKYEGEDADPNERHRLVKEILALNERRTEIEETLRFYAKHGKLPPQPTPDPELEQLSDIELQKRIGNVRSYITKNRNTLEKEKDDKKRSKAAANLKRYQDELSKLELLINQRLK